MDGLRVLVASLTLALPPTVVPAVVAAEPVQSSVVEKVEATRPTAEQAQAYAAREKQAPAELESFEGGQVVIAISTIGAIVLAAILLILLL